MNSTSVGNATMYANGTWTFSGPDGGGAVIDTPQPGLRTYSFDGITGFNG